MARLSISLEFPFIPILPSELVKLDSNNLTRDWGIYKMDIICYSRKLKFVNFSNERRNIV
jgi:hypothetical protein